MLTRAKSCCFIPPYDGPPLSAPLCLLTLAAPLREAGFRSRRHRCRDSSDCEQKCFAECRDAFCLGISVLTGPMIRGAVGVATAVKKKLLSLPVIFGGWHPSLLPEQTLNENSWMR